MAVDIDINDAWHNRVHIEVKLTGLRRFRFRVWIAKHLIALALWITGASFEFVSEEEE